MPPTIERKMQDLEKAFKALEQRLSNNLRDQNQANLNSKKYQDDMGKKLGDRISALEKSAKK